MKTLNYTKAFPDKLIYRTKERLVYQEVLPNSPGTISAGMPQLCAGAMLVREAVALYHSQEDAQYFENEVVVRDSDYIRSVGKDVGLEAKMLNNIILLNDRFKVSSRLGGMLNHLDRLRSPEKLSNNASVTGGFR